MSASIGVTLEDKGKGEGEGLSSISYIWDGLLIVFLIPQYSESPRILDGHGTSAVFAAKSTGSGVGRTMAWILMPAFAGWSWAPSSALCASVWVSVKHRVIRGPSQFRMSWGIKCVGTVPASVNGGHQYSLLLPHSLQSQMRCLRVPHSSSHHCSLVQVLHQAAVWDAHPFHGSPFSFVQLC